MQLNSDGYEKSFSDIKPGGRVTVKLHLSIAIEDMKIYPAFHKVSEGRRQRRRRHVALDRPRSRDQHDDHPRGPAPRKNAPGGPLTAFAGPPARS